MAKQTPAIAPRNMDFKNCIGGYYTIIRRCPLKTGRSNLAENPTAILARTFATKVRFPLERYHDALCLTQGDTKYSRQCLGGYAIISQDCLYGIFFSAGEYIIVFYTDIYTDIRLFYTVIYYYIMSVQVLYCFRFLRPMLVPDTQESVA